MTSDKILANGGILFIAVSWGLNFSMIKWALDDITPLYYLTMRFLLSGILIGLIFLKMFRKVKKDDVLCGALSGILLAGSFTAQTVGLQYTTPGKAGFLANACVVIVPFFMWALHKTRPKVNVLLGAALAFVGLAVMSMTEAFTLEFGDVLQLLCALCFAGQMMIIDRYTERVDPVRMAFFQVMTAGAITLIFALAMEPAVNLSEVNLPVIVAVAYGVIFCTALSFVIQGYAQRIIRPSNVSIILCFEAVFAFIFGLAFGYDHLTVRNVCGSAVVMIGFLISQIDMKNIGSKAVSEEK